MCSRTMFISFSLSKITLTFFVFLDDMVMQVDSPSNDAEDVDDDQGDDVASLLLL